ncbi:amidase [Corynebacterium sp. CCUG 59401]|nr:amidase [Corynebacterium pseudogenitalium]
MHPAFAYLAPDPQPVTTGRLSGWVIPAKDLSDVAGMPTTGGNPQRTYVAGTTSPFLAALQREGATINGKTATSELGATIYAERPDVPVLTSPAYPGATPGGSSTGAAVVVAEGLHRAAHGSDAGGSLRVPAAACEVVGFKPAGTSKTVSTDGFITATVADQQFLHNANNAYRRLRVGLLTTPLFSTESVVSPDRIAVVEQAAEVLGGSCDVVKLHPYQAAAETFTHFTRRIQQAFVKVDPLDSAYISWLKEQGIAVTAAQLAEGQRHIAGLSQALQREWGVDVLLTPTVATDPPPVGHFSAMSPAESFAAQTAWSPWCSLFNLTGGPAIAVGPIHIGGITASDSEVLALAAEVEDVWQEWKAARGV